MNNNLCSNHILCKQSKLKNLNYCEDCFINFNNKLEYNINTNNLTCPICFSDDNNNYMIKLYNCSHQICYDCIFSIYWSKSYLYLMPRNPYPILKKKWKAYINSSHSNRLKRNIINKLDSNKNKDAADYNFDILIIFFPYKLIPKIFRYKLKELVFYQIQVNQFLYKYRIKKYNKIKSIQYCPFCKTQNLF